MINKELTPFSKARDMFMLFLAQCQTIEIIFILKKKTTHTLRH